MTTSLTGNESEVQEWLPRDKPRPTSGPEKQIPWVNLSDQSQSAAPMSPFADDPAYQVFFDRLMRALHRTNPRHTILTRERGVGDHAVLMELAQQAKTGKFPRLKDKAVLLIDCRHLAPEESCAFLDALFGEVLHQEGLIVCLDGFGSLLQGGQGVGRSGSRSKLCRYLSKARCRIVGVLTPHEFEEYIANDADFLETFSAVHLHEPDAAVATKLVTRYAQGLQQRYQVDIDAKAVRRTVILSNSYVLHERLPSKAVKVLSAICDDVEFDRLHAGTNRKCVTEDDVIAKISEISGIPVSTLSGLGDNVDYYQSLSQEILGQEHVVRTVASELSLIKAGFVEGSKPASVMLFIGQTGTGKTEMAKALARLYSASRRLRIFTLGNFSEPHSVSGIIGVPAGYVGHEQGGRLINDLNSDPYGVFLLDEADKAHPDVLQPFLNLFDEGWICDQRGVKARADRAIFILTTNVGQRQMADMFREGKTLEEITHAMKETLAKTKHSKSNRPVFSPEFLARIKRIVLFRPLDEHSLLGIAQKMARQMADAWEEQRQKELCISEDVIRNIAEQAKVANERSQGREGGRIVRKLMAEIVETAIQQTASASHDSYRSAKRVLVSSSSAKAGEIPVSLQIAVEFVND